MSIGGWRLNNFKLKTLPGIRARLVLLAMILVVPLMFDRIRLLEDSRHRKIAQAQEELSEVALHTANAQREIIASIQAVLRSAAYIYASTPPDRGGCAILRASLRVDLPWIRTLTILGADGVAECSTTPAIVGLDLSDRDYYKRARDLHEFVLSDYIFSRRTELPTVVAAYPVSAIEGNAKAVIVAAVDLKWISQILSARTDRAGLTTLMIDSTGTILATQMENANLVGKKISDTALFDASMQDNLNTGSIELGRFTADRGDDKTISFAAVEGTSARIVLITDRQVLLEAINSNIQNAYLQLAVVLIFTLLGGWAVGERLIIGPVNVMTSMAQRFGSGDLSARAAPTKLPREFVPLADAFNNMADRLGARERELLANNNQLTVMASNDFLSGLANRRGFQSRLDFEWMKALQTGSLVSLLMIDVDHFKIFNDTYGHPEGDACLEQLGQVLARIAVDVSGFAARYGGEEFCLLLPDINAVNATEIGERVRSAIEELAIINSQSPTKTITVSVGVATTTPAMPDANGDLIEAADAALYAAKRRGRNTVVEHSLIRTGDLAMMRAS